MHIGFTGTRHGGRPIQLQALDALLKDLKRQVVPGSWVNLHHGLCVGADVQFHDAATKIFGDRDVAVHLHPCDVDRLRGEVKTTCDRTVTHAVKPPLERNHDIVDQSTVMIAMPFSPEITRSGTWSTVRYTKKIKKEIYIIQPSGFIELISDYWPVK